MKRAIIVSVLEQIEKNLEERIDIEKLVVITGYSRRSLQDFFKEKCGVSIGKYIRQRKLSRSATLLKLTSQSVTDIAFRMGFDSVQSYSREFKKTFGVNPNNYRKADFWDLRNLRPPNCFSALPVQLRCAFCRLHYFTGFNNAMITINISVFRHSGCGVNLRLTLRFNNLSRPGRHGIGRCTSG